MLNPDIGRKLLVAGLLPKREPGAEVGVWRGDFSAFLLRWLRPSELHLIDPWLKATSPTHEAAMYGSAISQLELDAIHDSVRSRFAGDPRVTIHRTSSLEAVDRIPAGHLGWAYIDGDHGFDGVMADLEAFLPKVRSGGYIVVDDFSGPGWWNYGPMRATAELLRSNDDQVRFRSALFNQAVLRKL